MNKKSAILFFSILSLVGSFLLFLLCLTSSKKVNNSKVTQRNIYKVQKNAKNKGMDMKPKELRPIPVLEGKNATRFSRLISAEQTPKQQKFVKECAAILEKITSKK